MPLTEVLGLSQDGDTHTADTVYEVSDDSARGIIADSLRRNLTSVKIRDADNYNDQTRDLLQKHMEMMPVSDVQVIGYQLRAFV